MVPVLLRSLPAVLLPGSVTVVTGETRVADHMRVKQ